MAPLPGHLTKVVWGGALAGGEIWSCSVMLAGTELPNDAQPAPSDFLLPIQDWFLRPATFIPRTATLTFVKANRIVRGPVGPGLPGGKYMDPESHTLDVLPPVVHPNVGLDYPNQICYAVTLLTAVPRGRGSHGRFYVPTTVPMDGDGRISVASAQGLADSAQELMSELGAAMDPVTGIRAKVVVYSNGPTTRDSRPNFAEPAEWTRVGRVLDTQRRRRNALVEAGVKSIAAI